MDTSEEGACIVTHAWTHRGTKCTCSKEKDRAAVLHASATLRRVTVAGPSLNSTYWYACDAAGSASSPSSSGGGARTELAAGTASAAHAVSTNRKAHNPPSCTSCVHSPHMHQCEMGCGQDA